MWFEVGRRSFLVSVLQKLCWRPTTKAEHRVITQMPGSHILYLRVPAGQVTKYKEESNLSPPLLAPAAAPDPGSVPLHSGRLPGKSHCPPSAGHCLWKPEAAYTLLCVL